MKKNIKKIKQASSPSSGILGAIEWYKIRKPIANAMLELGKLGFIFCGHGCGFGGEDFSLIRKDIYVNFCDGNKSCRVTINTNPSGNIEIKTIFEGNLKEAMKFVNENTKLLSKRVAY